MIARGDYATYHHFPSSLFVCPCPRFTCHPLGGRWGGLGGSYLVWHGFVAFAKPLLGACPRARGRCALTIRLVGWVVALWLVLDDGCGNPYLLSDDLPTCCFPASWDVAPSPFIWCGGWWLCGSYWTMGVGIHTYCLMTCQLAASLHRRPLLA